MKVLIINRDIGTGSVGRICEDLYFGIKNTNNVCKVAYGWKNNSSIPEDDLFCFSSPLAISRNALFARVFDDDGLRSVSQTKKLLSFMDVYSPDVVHVQGCYGYYINYEMLFSYLKNKQIPTVSTLHCCWDFTGHCCYFTSLLCDKWKNQCSKCPGKKTYPKSLFLDRSARNYNAKKNAYSNFKNCVIVTPSIWLSKMIKESFLSDVANTVINNGIDLETFKPTTIDLAKYNINPNKITILGVASIWDKRKGLDDFVALSKVIDYRFQIVLVGLTERQIRQMPENIICLKRTESKRDLAGLYTMATVLFNPTHEDNYPTVNLESIACGTQIVTYNTGGSPEAIVDPSFGITIERGDFQSLITYILSLKGKKIVKPEIQNYFSKNRMVNDYLSLYERMANRRR